MTEEQAKKEVLCIMLANLSTEHLNKFMHKYEYWNEKTFVTEDFSVIPQIIRDYGSINYYMTIEGCADTYLFVHFVDYEYNPQVEFDGVADDFVAFKEKFGLEDIAEEMLTDEEEGRKQIELLCEWYKEDETCTSYKYKGFGEFGEMNCQEMIDFVSPIQEIHLLVNVVVKAKTLQEAYNKVFDRLKGEDFVKVDGNI